MQSKSPYRDAVRIPTLSSPHAHNPPRCPGAALAAQPVEAAVNEQINVELTIAYVYYAMSAFFDRDNISLPGLAGYFREQSEEERGHAQQLVDFQNTRGGRVVLHTIGPPQAEYSHEHKVPADRGTAGLAVACCLCS